MNINRYFGNFTIEQLGLWIIVVLFKMILDSTIPFLYFYYEYKQAFRKL